MIHSTKRHVVVRITSSFITLLPMEISNKYTLADLTGEYKAQLPVLEFPLNYFLLRQEFFNGEESLASEGLFGFGYRIIPIYPWLDNGARPACN